MARSRSRSRGAKTRARTRPPLVTAPDDPADSPESPPASTSASPARSAVPAIPFASAAAAMPQPQSSPSATSGPAETLDIPPAAARSSPSASLTSGDDASDPPSGDDTLDPSHFSAPDEPRQDASDMPRWEQWARRACQARDLEILEGLLLTMNLAEKTEEPPPRGTTVGIHHFARRRLEWCVDHGQAPEPWLLLHVLFDPQSISDRLNEISSA